MQKKRRKVVRLLTFLITIVTIVSMNGAPVSAITTNGWDWYPVVTHSHSTYSQWADSIFAHWTVDGILKDLDKNLYSGACNISDHVGESNITMPWTNSGFTDTDSDGDGRYIIPIRGEEWGTEVDTNGDGDKDTETGHATVFGIDEGNNTPILVRKNVSPGCVNAATYYNLLDDATERGALVWANHPTSGYPWTPKVRGWHIDANGDGDYYDAGDWFYGLEGRMIGTEMWTWDWNLGKNQTATTWWQSLLAKCERKVVGIAASDFHTNTDAALLGPYIRVYAASTSPEDLKAALKAGRVIMGKDEKSPSILLDADTDGDGVYETMVGSTVPVTAAKTIKFRVRCYNSSSSNHVRIYTKSGWIDPGNPNLGGGGYLSAGSGNPWTYTFNSTYSANEKDFVRVELRQSWLYNYSPNGMTNPIYINVY